MNSQNHIYLPNCPEFVHGYHLYNKNERRGPIWFEARDLVQGNWCDYQRMAEGVGRIIRGWNRFYARYDVDTLSNTIKTNLATLTTLRDRDISTYNQKDKDVVLQLFKDFEEALKRISDSRKSPVSVSKALSLFAPSFLPIWDSNIAYAYGYVYVYGGGEKYVAFMDCMKLLAEHVKKCVPVGDDRPLLKRIDEFNYSKYTMHWV